ncbi:hypothetical protein ACFPYI_15150 [Halomarina salina]|uniref:Uncharacterized protein n=1 Tax=Halomarina salina TaxID=1872699 RepID=A0ABD5RPV0_9EURY|nr:hypothetical protein [Halomarina salina]
MNDSLTATVVAGTTIGLAVVLYATYAHLGEVVIAVGGCIVLLSVGLMTLAIARYEGDEVHESHDSHGPHGSETAEPLDRP